MTNLKDQANTKPKLWRDMTPEEKGALLLAHHEGKVIEFNGESVVTGEWTGWVTCDDDCLWDESFLGDGFAYRVRPEPKREPVTLYWRKGNPAHLIEHGDTHRITFDLIDDKPDCISIRMEEL